MKKRQKLPGAQLFTLRTQTLLYKGLNHLQKYDLAVLIGRIQNEDETYVHSRKLAGKHFNQPMDLGGCNVSKSLWSVSDNVHMFHLHGKCYQYMLAIV